MTTVILAEKPDQAKKYAQALHSYVNKAREGYFEVTDPIFKDKTYITFAIGHLVELAEPSHYDSNWEKWNMDSLPIFPKKFDFVISKKVEKQFNAVKKLLNEANTIIIATDCDREGENIAWSIIEKSGAKSKEKTYKRLWINSLEKDVIRKGFRNLKNGKETYPFYLEAQTRQFADWLIGMNASPLYSLLMQNKGVSGNFSVGRVQTPTLYLIYKRDKEVNSFKKETFYEIQAEIEKNKDTPTFKGALTPYKRFKDKEEVTNFLKSQDCHISKQSGTITNIETEDKNTESPSLFSLSQLQKSANKLFKATAADTLKAVQSLYNAQFLSYPRTDCSFITENEFDYLKLNFHKYSDFLSLKETIKHNEPRKNIVDSSKVKEHYAIIPTKKTPKTEEFEKLTDLQRKIYTLVLKTTIAMFYQNYEYKETRIETTVKNLTFKTIGKRPKNKGWKALFEDIKETEENKETLLPNLKIGDIVKTTINDIEKETTPPKLYTEGNLINAMINVNKSIEDTTNKEILKETLGIGTEATRANIIETLKKKEYIELKKNRLHITEKGKLLCKAVSKQELLTSAEMTAKWEIYLKKIGQNQGTQEIFLTNIKKFIIHLIENVPVDIENTSFEQYFTDKKNEEDKNIICKCPKCNGNIVYKKKFYGCSNYPTCKNTISDNFRNKKLTKKNVEDLASGHTTIIKGIKNKNKTDKYNAKITLNDKGYFEFLSFEK